MKFLFAAILIVTATSRADAKVDPSAALITANDFLINCNPTAKQADAIKDLNCAAYTNGVADGVSAAESFKHIQVFCKPEAVPMGKLEAVGLKFIQDNPSFRHYYSSMVLVQAWKEAFPCPTVKRKK